MKYARYHWLLLAENHLARRLIVSMLRMIAVLPLPDGERNRIEGNFMCSEVVRRISVSGKAGWGGQNPAASKIPNGPRCKAPLEISIAEKSIIGAILAQAK